MMMNLKRYILHLFCNNKKGHCYYYDYYKLLMSTTTQEHLFINFAKIAPSKLFSTEL